MRPGIAGIVALLICIEKDGFAPAGTVWLAHSVDNCVGFARLGACVARSPHGVAGACRLCRGVLLRVFPHDVLSGVCMAKR